MTRKCSLCVHAARLEETTATPEDSDGERSLAISRERGKGEETTREGKGKPAACVLGGDMDLIDAQWNQRGKISEEKTIKK